MASEVQQDWEQSMAGPLGEIISLAVYGPGVVSLCVRDMRDGEMVSIAVPMPPEWRELFARLWMEANRIADGEPPALTVAAVDPAAMERLGQLADAAQEACPLCLADLNRDGSCSRSCAGVGDG